MTCLQSVWLPATRWTALWCQCGILAICWALAAESRGQQTYEQAYDKLMTSWRDAAKDDKRTFDQVMEAADKVYVDLRTIQFKIKLSDKADEKAKLATELKTQEAEAFNLYKLALAKASDKDGDPDKMSEIRERVTYLTYQAGQFDDAATIGEYLARKNPENTYATRGAQIATAAYMQRYNQSTAAKKPEMVSDYLNRLVGITAYVAKQWKGKPEGQEAMGRLAKYAMAAGDQKQAESILSQLPKDAPEYYELNMRLGQGKWYKYLTGINQPAAQRPTQQQLDQWKSESKKALQTSVDWLRAHQAGPPNFTLLAGELSLVQLHNEDGEFTAAKKILELPKSGLLEQARLNLQVLQEGNVPLRPEIYKAGMRTYLGLKDYENAELVITGLSAIAGGGSQGDLTKVFASMAKQLYDEVEAMRQGGATNEQLQSKMASLAALLDRVAERKEGHTFGTLSWPAQTFYELAKKLDPGGADAPATAQEYYTKAAKVYDDILKRSTDDPKWGDPGSIEGIRVNLAHCNRRTGKHREALTQLKEILAANPRRIPAQIEAAYIYQDLAKQMNKPEIYDLAMLGGEPQKTAGGKGPEENVIWGWGKIAQQTARGDQYRDQYHEARYNQAYCRLRQALLRTDPAERKKDAASAENDIRITYSLSLDMGGPAWRGRFDQLLRAIQQELGKPVTGLPESKKK